jgi:hypothetical protein
MKSYKLKGSLLLKGSLFLFDKSYHYEDGSALLKSTYMALRSARRERRPVRRAFRLFGEKIARETK